MALPQLRPDGSLPPGRHSISDISDLVAAFPAVNNSRQALNAALVQFVVSAKQRTLGTTVVIDGSYITGKPEPEDIDLALLSTGSGETATLQQLNLDRVDLITLDVFVATTPSEFERWVRFFMADRAGQARGVVILTL